MADIIGPNSTLPGHLHSLPVGQKCDDHEDRLAVVRLQGETDSFGAELIDWCDECYQKYLKHKNNNNIGTCEICTTSDIEVKQRRDPEEGSYGRLYSMCSNCYKIIIDHFCEDGY